MAGITQHQHDGSQENPLGKTEVYSYSTNSIYPDILFKQLKVPIALRAKSTNKKHVKKPNKALPRRS